MNGRYTNYIKVNGSSFEFQLHEFKVGVKHTYRSGDIETLGRALLTRYLVPFEVAAVLLLIVMIGAAYMARRRVRENP